MAVRDFKRAAVLFLDSIATFTTYARLLTRLTGGYDVALCDRLAVGRRTCVIIVIAHVSSPSPSVRRTELFPYETSIFYTVITSLVALDRVSIKSKVVDAPEILTVIHKVPNLEPLLNSLYGCKYSSFVRVRLYLEDTPV